MARDEEEGCKLLRESDDSSCRDYDISSTAEKSQKRFKLERRISGRVARSYHNLKSSRSLWLGISFCTLALFAMLYTTKSASLGDSSDPFSGAFAIFPRTSSLQARQRRLTAISVWNDDGCPSYLRHFFYTAQLNNDTMDLLFINRRTTNETNCLNLDKLGIDITWGGNVNHVCMSDEEWKLRYVDFFCSEQYGWNCDSSEYEGVTAEFHDRWDGGNYNWRTFYGYVFRDLFPKPDNPFWAWLDQDVFVGNFNYYPFNVLSGVSFVTGSESVPRLLFMAGQLTAFNLDDEALATAWKKFPPMETASHFTNYTPEKMPDSAEELYWSYGFMRTDLELPGAELSYAVYPDIHGDDYYSYDWDRWGGMNTTQVYIVSGRDVVLTEKSYSREEIEVILGMERESSPDDFGNIGWTGGEDGSAYLVKDPTMTGAEARKLASSSMSASIGASGMHQGMVEDLVIHGDCQSRIWQCVDPHPFAITKPAIMRSSLVRFKDQQPGHLLTRLEPDLRRRGYERKLIRHHLETKHAPWFQLPPFEIRADMVLRYNTDFMEVFKVGEYRNETIYFRAPGKEPIG